MALLCFKPSIFQWNWKNSFHSPTLAYEASVMLVLILPRCTSAPLAFLFCEHGKFAPFLGPLHGLFPLPTVLFQLSFAWWTQGSASVSPPRDLP